MLLNIVNTVLPTISGVSIGGVFAFGKIVGAIALGSATIPTIQIISRQFKEHRLSTIEVLLSVALSYSILKLADLLVEILIF